jgi:hypothetical protein
MGQAQTGERTWLDERADRFEHEWKEGDERPRIEDNLAGQNRAARRLLLEELLRMERELRESAGEHPGADEYLARFPDDRAAVDAAFGVNENQPARRSEPPVSATQSLRFGLLALQNNFVDRETLLAAFNAWVADKSQPLGQILLDRDALSGSPVPASDDGSGVPRPSNRAVTVRRSTGGRNHANRARPKFVDQVSAVLSLGTGHAVQE